MNSEQFSLQGRTALVTGASSGIGEVLARALAQAGARVVAAARRMERLETLVEQLQTEGFEAMAVAMDVTDADSVAAAYEAAEQRFGVVDVIINNAGVADPKNFLKIGTQDRDWVMDTNFKGVWTVAQEGARRMAAAGNGGSIINIASILGLGAASGQSVYSASKGAVIQLTRSLAIDLQRHNIRCNAIAPGWFKTEINADFFNSEQGKAYEAQMPAKRCGELEELVGPVLLLASDAGSFVNGVVLPVDGAHSVRLL